MCCDDSLFVPEKKTELVYLAGAVERTGAFEMPEEREWMVTEAIAGAGGPTKFAKMSAGIVVRFDESGARQELAVDFQAILEGRNPDFPTEPNDVIFIPDSHMKEVGAGMLAMVPRIAAGFIFPF